MTRKSLLFVLLWAICLAARPAQAQNEPVPPLLISELYYHSPGRDEEEEWIEIANLGQTAVALADFSLGDEESQGGGEGMVRFPEEATIGPGQAVVVAQTAVAFQRRFGFLPDFEIQDSHPDVPDMRPNLLWSGGRLALANDGDEALLLYQTAVHDSLNYGQTSTFFEPAIQGVLAGQSIERVPADCDTDSAADWLPRPRPTPGELDFSGICLYPAAGNTAVLPIGAIQGRGEFSPYVNQIVTLRGIVTGLLADRNSRGTIYYTLFVQDAPGATDGDPATSDGVALFVGRQRPLAQIGDLVRVTGQVTEFFGLTELADDGLEIVVEAQGQPLPEPVIIDPPGDNAAQSAYFEALEGMRVALPGPALVAGPTFSTCGFAVVGPGQSVPVLRRQASDPIGHILPVLHTTDVDCAGFPDVKVGDTVAGLTGPLTYHFDQFKLVHQETAVLQVTAVPFPPLPAPPQLAANQFSVASFNMENHFDAQDDTGHDAEPKPSPAEIGLKQRKLAAAISQVLACPTLVAVQEVEKEALLMALAQETAVACGFVYTVTHLESADARGIDLALLSDPRRVQVQAAHLRQGCTDIDTGIRDVTAVCPPTQSPLFSRPPLQVDMTIDAMPHTIYVNHFKSKLGGEEETAGRRLAQAEHLLALVAERLAADPAARLIVLGDFNDYELSPTLLALTEDGRLTNVLSQVPLAGRYSYNFGGAAQLIDAVLVTPALAAALADVAIYHVNADYPDSLGQDVTPAGLPYKSTDHDLSLAIFALSDAELAAPTAVAPQNRVGEATGWLWWMGGGGTAVLLALLVARRRRSG